MTDLCARSEEAMRQFIACEDYALDVNLIEIIRDCEMLRIYLDSPAFEE